MTSLTQDDLRKLQATRLYPCISLYLPTAGEKVEPGQGPVRLRNMVKATEEALHDQGVRTPVIEMITKPVRELYDDTMFWTYSDSGLALFFNEEGLRIVKLPIACDESVTIADRYMIRPLLPLLDQNGQFALLVLGLADPRLYRCSISTMEEIELEDLPASVKSIIQTYDQEKQMQHHKASGRARREGGQSVFGGSFSGKENDKSRIEEYFRKVDQAVQQALADTNLPLVLDCVDYLYPIYRGVSHLEILDGHVTGKPDVMDRKILLSNAYAIAKPTFDKDKTAALNTLGNLMGTPRVIEDIRLILPAAMHRQIDTLFLTPEAKAWGSSDSQSGRVVLAEDREPEFGEEELFDQAAVQTLKHGGRIYLLNHDEMPEKTQALAILRYETPMQPPDSNI